MIRQTSLDAYKTIIENGLLSERRARVYDILYHNGPLIGAEVSAIYTNKFGKTSKSETIRNRLTELRELGVVREVGKSFDKHTGMKVILWDVTDQLPVKPDKKLTTKQKLDAALKELDKCKAILTMVWNSPNCKFELKKEIIDFVEAGKH